MCLQQIKQAKKNILNQIIITSIFFSTVVSPSPLYYLENYFPLYKITKLEEVAEVANFLQFVL